ncbi:MAG: hypothetical protein K9J30_09845 [Bacteroidales bacterium]|nr:hypothetical protein [Bacteroidales bacterium]
MPVADGEIGEDDQVKPIEKEESKTEISEEDIRKAWDEYAEKIRNRHPRQYNTLKQHLPKLDANGAIRVELATESQRENFTHSIKPGLISYFRQALKDIEYVFETSLIENNTSEKKPYTDQDKLDVLMKKNPDLEIFKNRFNLDFDN